MILIDSHRIRNRNESTESSKSDSGIRSGRIDWDAVYRDLLPQVYNYFRYRLGDDGLAEELTAVTFEKAWRKRRRYRRDLAAFSTWVMTIARNTATDHFRRQGRRQTVAIVEELISAEPAPTTIVQKKQDNEHLQTLLTRLPEREREIIALKYSFDLTNREIARELSLTESNVGTILHRTLRKMRLQWEQHDER